MKKILKFHREDELESKWWHRMAKVLIYASTIVVLIVSIVCFIKNIPDWNNPDPKYVYSFESNYSETHGFSKPCTFVPNNNEATLSIECGDLSKNRAAGAHFLADFFDRYARSNSYKEEFLAKNIKCNNGKVSSLEDIFSGYCYLVPNYDLLNERIEQGAFNDITAKRVIVMSPLVKNTLWLILIPLIWFFLMKSVIYRSLVYVILGKIK